MAQSKRPDLPKGAVPESSLGHAYQGLFGFFLLLEALSDPTVSVQIETLDDVVVYDGDGSQQLLQTKRHEAGALSENSPDFWKTVDNWIDIIESPDHFTIGTRFVLRTTQDLKAGSELKSLCCDCTTRRKGLPQARAAIDKAARRSNNEATKKYRHRYLALSSERRDLLLGRAYIESSQPCYSGVEARIKRILHYGVRQTEKVVDRFYEALMGWWTVRLALHLRKTIDGLRDFIGVEELRSVYNEFREQFNTNTLFVDPKIRSLTASVAEFSDRPFLAQLALITSSDVLFRDAVRNYYRAYTQRTQWIADDLCNLSELEAYEATLVEEWERFFALAHERHKPITEDQKKTCGLDTYASITNHRITIRDLAEPFIQLGSLHMLADKLQIGWHPEFLERLKDVLESA